MHKHKISIRPRLRLILDNSAVVLDKSNVDDKVRNFIVFRANFKISQLFRNAIFFHRYIFDNEFSKFAGSCPFEGMPQALSVQVALPVG